MVRRRLMLTGGRTVVLVFAIFFALAAFGMQYLQKANNENAWRLANEGAISLATITNKRIQTTHTNHKNLESKSSGGIHYVLEYSFPLVDSNEEWQGNDDVSKEDFDSVEIGDQYEVIYWLKDPDIATILEDAYAAGAKLARTISIILYGLSFVLIMFLFRRPQCKDFNGS